MRRHIAAQMSYAEYAKKRNDTWRPEADPGKTGVDILTFDADSSTNKQAHGSHR